jgi:CheY-like chemotaxis protein
MRRINILLADNDTDSVKALQEFLEHEGYRVLTASNPTQARHILDHEQTDLAILDIRLLSDEDEKDISGLALAKETNPIIPKIVLTRFPTYQAVREALGPALDGLPPAVGFVAKQEGLEVLLRYVRLALLRLPSIFETKLLHAFQVSATLALPDRIKEVGLEQASHRLQQSFDSTSAEITKYREQENKRASQYHLAGLTAAVLGLILVLGSIIMIWLNYITAPVLPLIVSVLVEAVSALFFIREDAAYKRVSMYFTQLNELNQIGNLLAICDSLTSPSDREKYRKKIIDHIIGTWLVHSS